MAQDGLETFPIGNKVIPKIEKSTQFLLKIDFGINFAYKL